MDDNVMKKYTTMSTEAIHYVQYDQGKLMIFVCVDLRWDGNNLVILLSVWYIV